MPASRASTAHAPARLGAVSAFVSALFEKFVEEFWFFEQRKVLSQLSQVQRRTVYFQKYANVVQVACSRGIVHKAL